MNAALDTGMEALARTVPKNEDMIARLVPIAQELAWKFGTDGITTTDLRLEASDRRILTGLERGKDLSYLGAVMKRAGLVNSGNYRRSTLKVTHGIPQAVWHNEQYSAYRN